MDATPPDTMGTATHELLTAAGGDRCATCQAPLASDQRYCVNCGERRGKTRFSFATLAAEATPPPAPPAQRRRPRASAGTTLVAGVATLLLAMGVGVLIGNNSAKIPAATRASAVAPQVIRINAGSGSGGAATSTTRVTRKKPAKVTASAAAAKVKITPKVAAAATSAANKVLGSSANRLAPATVQPGQACTHGSGCQNGKFTGNFFGQ